MNNLCDIYGMLGISPKVLSLAKEAEEALEQRFKEIDEVAEYNQIKVLSAMQKNRVAENHFAESTGYGYNDYIERVMPFSKGDTQWTRKRSDGGDG